MTIKLIERNPEYWEKMRGIAENIIKGHSDFIGKNSKDNYKEPILEFKMDYSESEIFANIRRVSDTAIVTISLGFFIWLDDAAKWMNRDARFRKYLKLTKLSKDKDLSEFMMSLWITWVVAHELGHFFCGHLSSSLTKEWHEYDAIEQKNTSSNFNTLAYEYDADMYAASLFFGSIKTVIKSSKSIRKMGIKFFFDLGMIFAGIFNALDYLNLFSNANSHSHPEAADRMLNFINYGFISNSRDKSFSNIKNKKMLLKGASTYAVILGDDAIEFMEKLNNFDTEGLINAKKHLINNKMHTKRLYRFTNDWLLYKSQ